MRIDLTRSVPFTVTRADDEDGDGLTLEGYAAVFGQATRIDSWEGTFDETMRRGAFRKTLRERTPLMQYDHGRHPLVGSIPIGRYDSLAEDEQGLRVVGRLTDNWLMQPVRDAISDGGVTGMSIRFEVVRDEWRDVNGKLVKADELLDILWMGEDHERGPLQRTIIEARLLEAGPVAWPAYVGTSVGVRARELAGELMSDEERRRAVRRSLAASAVTAGIDDDPDVDTRDLAVAVLLAERNQTPAAPPSGHPAVDDAATADDVRTTGEPEAPERTTSATEDAPPAAGHPSLTPDQQRAQYLRRAYLTRHGIEPGGVGKG